MRNKLLLTLAISSLVISVVGSAQDNALNDTGSLAAKTNGYLQYLPNVGGFKTGYQEYITLAGVATYGDMSFFGAQNSGLKKHFTELYSHGSCLFDLSSAFYKDVNGFEVRSINSNNSLHGRPSLADSANPSSQGQTRLFILSPPRTGLANFPHPALTN